MCVDLHGGGARSHDSEPLGVHQRQVVQSQHVSGLGRQAEVLVRLLEVPTDADTACTQDEEDYIKTL